LNNVREVSNCNSDLWEHLKIRSVAHIPFNMKL